jgi:hypothetical protein
MPRQAKADRSRQRAEAAFPHPPEKPKACANEPKPPRVTRLDPESDVPEADWFEEESPLKKLLREDPPPEPWLDEDEEVRGGHSVLLCNSDGDATFGGRSQFSLGISA